MANSVKVTEPNWEALIENVRENRNLLSEACIRGRILSCKVWVDQIEFTIQRITKESLQQEKFTEKKKRGLVDDVGHIYKFLFRTIDSEDSAKIYAKIVELNERDGRAYHALKY